jgi:hypothetical protein
MPRDVVVACSTGYVTSTDDHEQVFLAINDVSELVVSRNARNWIHAFFSTLSNG